MRDRKGTSSIDDLILASSARAGRTRRKSIAARQSAIRRAAHACIAQDRAASGQTGVTPTSKPAPPVIAGTKVSQHPELVRQWHPAKNGTVRPEDVPAGTPKKYWWKKRKGETKAPPETG